MPREAVKRVNIQVRDGIELSDAVKEVAAVIAGGRISGKCFCYVTSNCLTGHVVVAGVTKAGHDSFTVYLDERVRRA